MSIQSIAGVDGTFSRASDGGLVQGRGNQSWNDSELLRLVGPHADDMPRFEHVLNADGIYVPSLRLEGARTNGLTRAEELDNAAWTKTRSSITADDVVAPDGQTTADKLVEDGTASNSHHMNQLFTATADTTQAFSVYVKGDERTFVSLQIVETGTGNFVEAFFNLTTGVVGTLNNDGTGTGAAGFIEDVGNGWFRCTVTGTPNNSATALDVRISLADADDSTTYNGDGTSGLHLWGGQVEIDQPFASTYNPTVGSTVTRALESLSWLVPFTLQPMTIYSEHIERGSVNVNDLRLWHIGATNSSTDPRLFVHADPGQWEVFYDDGTNQVESGDTLATPVIGDLVQHRSVLNPDGSVLAAQRLNGGVEELGVASGAATLPAAFAAPTSIHLNIAPASTVVGFGSYIALKIAAGVRSMEFMEEVI